jgi:hypothetical protein
MGILRDRGLDQTLKMAVVEGCMRILISEKSCHAPEEIICAMILQYFDRPDSEKNALGKNRAVYPS